jgi:hypothetical protein
MEQGRLQGREEAMREMERRFRSTMVDDDDDIPRTPSDMTVLPIPPPEAVPVMTRRRADSVARRSQTPTQIRPRITSQIIPSAVPPISNVVHQSDTPVTDHGHPPWRPVPQPASRPPQVMSPPTYDNGRQDGMRYDPNVGMRDVPDQIIIRSPLPARPSPQPEVRSRPRPPSAQNFRPNEAPRPSPQRHPQHHSFSNPARLGSESANRIFSLQSTSSSESLGPGEPVIPPPPPEGAGYGFPDHETPRVSMPLSGTETYLCIPVISYHLCPPLQTISRQRRRVPFLRLNPTHVDTGNPLVPQAPAPLILETKRPYDLLTSLGSAIYLGDDPARVRAVPLRSLPFKLNHRQDPRVLRQLRRLSLRVFRTYRLIRSTTAGPSLRRPFKGHHPGQDSNMELKHQARDPTMVECHLRQARASAEGSGTLHRLCQCRCPWEATQWVPRDETSQACPDLGAQRIISRGTIMRSGNIDEKRAVTLGTRRTRTRITILIRIWIRRFWMTMTGRGRTGDPKRRGLVRGGLGSRMVGLVMLVLDLVSAPVLVRGMGYQNGTTEESRWRIRRTDRLHATQQCTTSRFTSTRLVSRRRELRLAVACQSMQMHLALRREAEDRRRGLGPVK